MSAPPADAPFAKPRLAWVGDHALLVEFGSTIDAAINDQVLTLAGQLREAALPGVLDIVPTYRSLLLRLDPLGVDREPLMATVKALAAAEGSTAAGRLWTLPVAYGGPFGPDLAFLADHAGLDEADLVRRHAAVTYRVYMIGFQPGFAYLGGLDPALACSRRAEPRPRVPAGSVMLGGIQAAVASVATPSGWHLLGQTPEQLFQPARDPVVLLAAGDMVRFSPIDASTFAALSERSAKGEIVARMETSA